MTAILPISTVRVSDALVRTRLTQQVQSDQLALFRVQSQLSTGRRIFNPSDDAPAALRAITLQRNLERQTQLQRNLDASTRSLSATGSALRETGAELTDIRAAALSVAGTDATQQQRNAVAQQVDEAINSLLRFGNSRFRDNFLFGGSIGTVEPYAAINGYVEYRGNEQSLQSFVDSNVLFDINITGQETLGGISEAVRGASGLSPQLTADTLLSQLNGGAGAPSEGAIQIDFVPDTPGGVVTDSTTIDLRAANTVGDVARLIEAGAPPAAGVKVNLVGGRLEVQTTGPIPGGVAITEVGQGRTAEQLGVLAPTASSAIAGEPLDPTLRLTTRLDTLFGSRSQARLVSVGNNNDLVITATQNGASADPEDPLSDPLNGVAVQFVGVAGGPLSAAYDGAAGTLTVTVDSDNLPTAAEVAEAINSEPSGYFNAAVDPSDATEFGEAGEGVIALAATATTAGGAGTRLDLASGLQIENGDGPVAIDTSGAETVFDLLETLNRPELGLIAELNSTQTGIDVRTRRSGAGFAIGENGGQLATQLGLRTFTLDSRLEDFNRGIGVAIAQGTPEAFAINNVLQIEVVDGGATTRYDIDLTGVVTVGDLVDRIADETGGVVQGTLASVGNGLVLTGANGAITAPTPASGAFEINGDTLSLTANTPGSAGNRQFSISVVDEGTGGLSVGVEGDAITINLGGDSPNTADVAAAIDAQLSGYTVGVSTAPLVTPQGGLAVSTTGGVATPSTGSVTLDGDTLTLTADTPGAAGDQTFTLNITDSGSGGLSVAPAGGTLNIDLGGAAPDTAALALEITNQLAGYTATSDGNAAVTTQAGLTVTTAGGASANSTGRFALNGGVVTLTADTPGPAGDQGFGIEVVDTGFGGLAVGVADGLITVDLGGAAATAADVAAAIDAQLPGYSASVGAGAAVTPQGGLAVTTQGGVELPSTGSVNLDGDTLTFSADAAGPAGDQAFTLDVADSGSGGLQVGVAGGVISVDLGGASPNTAAVAAEITNQLAGYTVVSNGAATVTTQSGLAVTTSGGASAAATGGFVLNGNQITLTADAPGAAGNQAFTVDVVDTGAGGLAVGVAGGAITIDLGGGVVDTAEVAAAIDAQLAGYSATADPNSVVTPQQGLSVATTGGLDISATGADRLVVRGEAAQRLGFFSAEADPPEAVSTTGAIATAEDRHTLEVDSAFNTLIRLRRALQTGDTIGIGEAVERLDRDLDRAVFAESEVGARVQTLDVLRTRLEDEEVQIRTALSDEIDVDLTEAISEFTARQFALQASLQTTANLLQLSILDFI